MKFYIVAFLSVMTLTLTLKVKGVNIPCAKRDYNQGSFVCMCNATYCDTQEPFLGTINDGEYFQATSTKGDLRHYISTGKISECSTGPFHANIRIDRNVKYQTIIGFGGSFTDAVGINIASLSPELQKILLDAYYAKNGSEYNMGRVPIAGSDFSIQPYTYDDLENGDTDDALEYFNLTMEDYNYKIRYIWEAQKRTDNLLLVASAWSAPTWMKTNNDFTGVGFLKEEKYQIWANYYLRFLEDYAENDITFWGITTQNEPLNCAVVGFNSMCWKPHTQKEWIKFHLGPTLKSSPFNETQILAYDDTRLALVPWCEEIFSDPLAAKYISGIAIHWYADFVPPELSLDVVHEKYSDKFMIMTEACEGSYPGETDVSLGSWERGESYACNIIQNLKHWVTGWIDWNIALDLDGGPNWANNNVDSPIIVNATADEFYKQPMYYALQHFSKYIPRDSVRISSTCLWGLPCLDLEILAVERPDGRIAVVLVNKLDMQRKVVLEDTLKGCIHLTIPKKSICTIVY